MRLVEIANEMSQEEWVRWHNKNRSIMASAHEIYLGAKKKRYSIKTDAETSTRIYWGNRLQGEVIHHFENGFVPTAEAPLIEIPIFEIYESRTPREESLVDNILSTEIGKQFLQHLFGTQDNEEEILATLSYLGAIDRVYVETPRKKIRKKFAKVSIVRRPTELHIKCYLQTFGRGKSVIVGDGK